MENIVMHIDVNNAFLSWTAIYLLKNGYDKDIRNTYAVIGGDEASRTGIVLAKSNLCKKLNIKTGDTLYSARLKCKDLKVYPPIFKFYSEKSNELFSLLKTYTPDIEIASIDECYMDYGKVKNLYGDELEFAHKLKDKIKKELGFTVNIGIANNKLCAKMASDFSKPDKVHTLYEHEIKTKMWPLKVEELFGIGRATYPKLKELGIKTIQDLANYNEKTLRKYFKNQAQVMIDKANGIDNSNVNSKEVEQKGIGNEFTLNFDTSNKEIINNNLIMLSEMTGLRLRKQKKYATTIVVNIKTSDFLRKSHQKKLDIPTNNTEEILKTSKEIFEKYFREERIRLIGIRLDKLTTTRTNQISLFDKIEQEENLEKLDKTIDSLKEKYGYNIISKASVYNNKAQKNRRGL